MAALSSISAPLNEHAVYILASHAIYGTPRYHGSVKARVEERLSESGSPPAETYKDQMPLLVGCYQVGIVLYEAGRGAKWQTLEARHGRVLLPEQEWLPRVVDARTRYLHFVRNDTTLELVTVSTPDRGTGMPNKVIGPLSETLTDNARSRSPYSLEVYDTPSRTHQCVGTFVSIQEDIHVLRIDARHVANGVEFYVCGCTAVAKTVFIYACASSGQRATGAGRRASLVARWYVDYCNPRVVPWEADEEIVVVEAETEDEANKRIASAYACTVVTNKPVQ